ncbi:olfactory receptor 12D1-like [Lithobates pipiens]
MSQMSPDSQNWTFVDGFLLLGLTEEPSLQRILFVTFLITYALNLIGNAFIILLVILEQTLHTPMYFFLGNLSFFDICFSSVTVPKMLQNLRTQHKVISVMACLAQMHFFHFLGSSEVLLLTAMSYDRYVAICKPLHYCGIMNRRMCVLFALGSWIIGFLHSLMHTLFTAQLSFCGPNRVNHFFCDIKPLLKLACADTTLNAYLLEIVTGSLVMISFFLTLLSYIFISSALLRIRSSTGRLRAFSTCASHLTVVILLYGTAIFTYVRPITEESLQVDRFAAIFFTVVTPMLNPFIYTLRNQDVQNATKRLFRCSM